MKEAKHLEKHTVVCFFPAFGRADISDIFCAVVIVAYSQLIHHDNV